MMRKYLICCLLLASSFSISSNLHYTANITPNLENETLKVAAYIPPKPENAGIQVAYYIPPKPENISIFVLPDSENTPNFLG